MNPFAGMSDAFAAVLNSGGALQRNTFMGSSEDDSGRAIALDGSGNVYVAGESSATWGVPLNAFAGPKDAFAAKLATDLDGDGYGFDTDCDDGNGAINPGTAEVCDDGIDNDCDLDIDSADTDCNSEDGGGGGGTGGGNGGGSGGGNGGCFIGSMIQG